MSDDKNARFERGLETLTGLDPDAARRVLESLNSIAPDFAKYMVEFPFGDLYQRPGLNLRDRELVAVVSLATLGYATTQLKFHLSAALTAGCTRQEIVEALMQVCVYAGFPCALNALYAAQEVFAAHGNAG